MNEEMTYELDEEYAARMAESDMLIEHANGLSVDEFAKLKVAERDAILFAYLRQQAGSIKALEMKIAEYEQKARDLMTPEGIEEAKKKVMDALGFGGGLGGMLGGML